MNRIESIVGLNFERFALSLLLPYENFLTLIQSTSDDKRSLFDNATRNCIQRI